MIEPLRQMHRHKPEAGEHGDCFRTCVAMLLNLEPESVPHFAKDAIEQRDDPGVAVQMLRDWLAPRGLALCQFMFPAATGLDQILLTTSTLSPGVPFMIFGQSPRGDWGHVVVALDGQIADPAVGDWLFDPLEALSGPTESNDGESWWWVECIVRLPDPLEGMDEEDLRELSADINRAEAARIKEGMV